MSSRYAKQAPVQPDSPGYNRMTPRLFRWLHSLPVAAWRMSGPLNDDGWSNRVDARRRIIYTECPDQSATDEEKLRGWPSVSYQAMAMTSPDGFYGVFVAFHLPASGNYENETFYVGLDLWQWANAYVIPSLWKRMVLAPIPSDIPGTFYAMPIYRRQQ
ncbi:hypothetical protein FRC04_005732 [Tulasnella sp. 424]|nr:hypothetical protein FRC04_005732 [Tulasnella sp. 424]KAG8977524.1 hypothetical protein FRC05_001382 [Tulasnella sp. 425]